MSKDNMSSLIDLANNLYNAREEMLRRKKQYEATQQIVKTAEENISQISVVYNGETKNALEVYSELTFYTDQAKKVSELYEKGGEENLERIALTANHLFAIPSKPETTFPKIRSQEDFNAIFSRFEEKIKSIEKVFHEES